MPSAPQPAPSEPGPSGGPEGTPRSGRRPAGPSAARAGSPLASGMSQGARCQRVSQTAPFHTIPPPTRLGSLVGSQQLCYGFGGYKQRSERTYLDARRG